MYVNGRQVPAEGLSLNTANIKTSTMAYQTLLRGLGIHHANTGLQISHELNMKGYFMLLFDLTPDHSASESHTSLADNGNIRIELKFDNALSDALTALLYLEYDASV
jgi:thymidylate kinase